MLTRLIITEKPSVAMRYAAVLGVKGRQDGYLEGRGYLISWCFGHLWGLADADAYDPKYKKWNQNDLPILPATWQYQLLPGSQKQMALLRRLMDREDVTEIVNACDPGREGELIFRNVYNLAQCTKPMLRLWVSSMEDEAVREGFAHLRPGLAFNGVYEAALCRAQADWLVGINATRLFSAAYHRTLVIGRVISPTLSMVVNREQEIASHKPETFYRVCLMCEGVVFQSKKLDQAQAEALAPQCAGQTGVVEELLSHRADIGFTGTVLDEQRCIYIPFYEDELVVITPGTEHFLSRRGSDAEAWIREEPVILREEGSGTRREAGRLLAGAGIALEELNVVASIQNQETIKRSVGSGMGISILSALAAEEEIRNGRLLAFPLGREGGKRNINLVFERDFPLIPAADRFVEVMENMYPGIRSCCRGDSCIQE